MADKLDFDLAVALVERLQAIGHPYSRNATIGTAEFLVEWCKGVILPNGAFLGAEGQAAQLVKAACMWEDGWPERGGIAKLNELFRKLFVPPVKPSNGFIDYANEPCICGSQKKFKNCCQDRPPRRGPVTAIQ